LACDIRIASSNAQIGQTEVKVGIPPGWGGTQRTVRIVGPAKAKELVFTGRMTTAEEALRIGLVNKVVSLDTPFVAEGKGLQSVSPSSFEEDRDTGMQEKPDKLLNKILMDESIDFAKEITKNSYNAVRVSKMLINKATDTDIQTGLRLEIYGWALCFAHEDRESLMSAFLNKRNDQKKAS
jgi:3-hydroxypropionyl-coenzyme A dehydratase